MKEKPFNHSDRALDLTAEVLEGSGATVLCAGSHIEQGQMVETLIEYRVNGIAGDPGQPCNYHDISLPSQGTKKSSC